MEKIASGTAPATESRKHHCVTFVLGDEMFAVDIHFVREIIEFESMTTVPMMPSFVRGIINLRGAVVPVIDLSVRFGRGLTEIRPSTCVAILSIDGGGEYNDIGVLLDGVREVVEIPEDEIDPSPSFGARMRGDFIKGIATLNQRFAILLDVQKALSLEELSALADKVAEQYFSENADPPLG